MAAESKKVIYKLAEGVPNGETLQAALAKSLAHYKSPAKRVNDIGNDGSHVRFINMHRGHQKLIVGIFHRVSPGAGQYIIEMAGTDGEWSVQLITAKADGKVHREFVEGTLFFAIWKNNVIMLQSNACRADQFQEYCSWLLSRPLPNSPAGSANQAVLVALSDPLPPDLRKKSNQMVKSIKFGGSIETGVAGKTGSKTQRTAVHFTPKGRIWEGVKSILRELKADVPDDLLLDTALGERDIRVSLELSCTKKKAQSTAGEVLGVIGRTLSHSDADAFTIELADGSKIRPKEMKVEKNVRVECVQKQPVPEAIFKAMVDWMQELVNSKVVIEQEPLGNAK